MVLVSSYNRHIICSGYSNADQYCSGLSRQMDRGTDSELKTCSECSTVGECVSVMSECCDG